MKRPGELALRVLLLAYPRDFRRAYGDDMVGLVRDQRRLGGWSVGRTVRRLVTDVVRTAPRMRWERPMNRLVLVVSGATALLILVLLGGPFLLLAIAAMVGVVLLSLAGAPGSQPFGVTIPTDRAAHWWRWLAAAGVLVAVGFVPLVGADGGELSSSGWSVWVVSWTAGIVTGVTGVVLGALHGSRRRPRPPADPA